MCKPFQFVIIGIIAIIAALQILNPNKSIILVYLTFFCLPVILTTATFSRRKLNNLIREMQFIHVLWILLLVGLLMFFARTSNDLIQNPVPAQKFLRIFSALIVCFFSFSYVLKQNKFSLLFRGPLLFFFFYCVSSAYTLFYTSYLGYSSWKAFELMIGFFAISAIISSEENETNIITVNAINFTWNIILLITIMIGAVIYPDMALYKVRGALLPQLRGLYPIINANSVGSMSAIAILFVSSKIIDSGHKRLPLYFSFIAFLVVMIFAQSRTSMLGLTISISILLFFKRRIKLLVSIVFIAILIAVFSMDIFKNFFNSYVLRGNTMQSTSIQTVSGRTEGWNEAIKMFYKSPVLGYGVASGARYDVLAKIPGREDQGGLHNAFLDVLINNGIVGFIPWIISYLWTLIILLKRAIKCFDDKLSPLFLSILIFFGVRMTTGDALVYHDNSMLFFLGILAYAQLLHLKKLNIVNNLKY